MASRFRIGTALLGATAALAFSALPAHADVTITPDRGGQEKGLDVVLLPVGNINDPNELKQDTSIIKLRIEDDKDRSTVLTYCVELPTPLEDGDVLKEATWGTHPNPKSKFPQNAGKVLWILQNSYPGKSMADVKKAFGDQFNKEETIAATQAAIWHFSDDAQLNSDKTDADVVKLYERLIKDAAANEIKDQPKPTLEIDPASKSGKSGEKIGPFKVTTTASEVKLTANLPEGVTVTDAAGNPLAVQKKGDELAVQGTGEKVSEFFVNVPANAPDGSATFKLSAQAEIAIGRLFVAHNKKQDDKAQSLVVAQPQKAKVEKEAKADWKVGAVPTTTTTTATTTTTTPETTTPTTSTTPANPAPGGGEDDLASTGASILWPLLGGLVLVGAGVGALFVVRRKKAGA
ncbi:LPXTG-motif cell wall anchor domain-containing protein/TQXA domain-containing protein [Lentzea waywayandensis]|uniref:LPXTG-motif cell wall anchor domain-containing protein/TQXA domain-containing protein n=1 Tax=Lentzea waywayandensis TaxID=84724 RepID=A0A1I6EFF2_9PSEU|nr:thioester domain-containing protein [Lentzea waywayandensis]SFR16251.1 LPXTG-motif cell wall anchor domain-containing protein/TQXA domain-containing protein [Lentzea waywayandensis]